MIDESILKHKKIVALFPGQGSQSPQMGKDVYETYPKAKEIFDLDGDIRNLCFNADKETLAKTINTQPALFLNSLSIFNAFVDKYKDLNFCGYLGFSLGELSAIFASVIKNVDNEDEKLKLLQMGIDIVKNRAKFMDEGNEEDKDISFGMLAAIGNKVDIDELIKISKVRVLSIANYNSPTQFAISGDEESLENFKNKSKEFKIKAIPLSVSSAFHSVAMREPASKFYEYLSKYEVESIYKYLNLVFKNTTAAPFDNKEIGTKLPKENIKSILELDTQSHDTITNNLINELCIQILSPVRFSDSIKNIEKDLKPDLYIEFGAGKVLTNLTKKNIENSNASFLNISSVSDF